MDVYDQLIELGRMLYPGDEAAAVRFARGRAMSESAAREEWSTPGPTRPANRATVENSIFTQLRAAGVPVVEAQRRARAAVAGTGVAESVATLERPRTGMAVREASGTVRTSGPGRMLVRLLSPGWSLNGRFYPESVLRNDGPEAFPAGLHMHIDHATDEEDAARPAGSLRTLAGVLESAASWNDSHGGLVAPVRLFPAWRETLTSMAQHIGVSIRAWIDGREGVAENRRGFIVDELVEGRSVDFVTTPAAGGRILMAESAAARARGSIR